MEEDGVCRHATKPLPQSVSASAVLVFKRKLGMFAVCFTTEGLFQHEVETSAIT